MAEQPPRRRQLGMLIVVAQTRIRRAVTVREVYAAGMHTLADALPQDHHGLLSIDAEQLQWLVPPVAQPPWASRIPARLDAEMVSIIDGPHKPATQLLRHVLTSPTAQSAQIRVDGLVIAVLVASPREGCATRVEDRHALLAAVAAAMSAQLTRVVAVATGAPAVRAAPCDR